MKYYSFYFKFIAAAFFVGTLFSSLASAQDAVAKETQTVLLGETPIKINVYEKKGSRITFFAPHYTEQVGTNIVKETIGKSGGRLIEIENVDETGKPARFLKFQQQENFYTVDPNRIFTDNGRTCSNLAPEITQSVKTFADNLLKIIFPADGTKLRAGEKFLVAVHNNANVDDSNQSDASAAVDLTAYAFARYGKKSAEIFYAQADGVYLSNVEFDADNFFFLSTTQFLKFFADRGFNTVVQKSAAKLQDKNCHVDDGSLSVYAGQRNIPYLNVEADIVYGNFRQRQMIAAVYELLNDLNKRKIVAELTDKDEAEEK